jgi:hypothetical protein
MLRDVMFLVAIGESLRVGKGGATSVVLRRTCFNNWSERESRSKVTCVPRVVVSIAASGQRQPR